MIKLSELIQLLQETYKYNDDMNIVGMVDGNTYHDIEINCPDDESPLYIELYQD